MAAPRARGVVTGVANAAKCARRAMLEKLQRSLPADRAAAMEGCYVETLEDNLLPSLSPDQRDAVTGSVRPTDRRIRAAHSSAALAANVFAGFVSHESHLRLGDLTGFGSLAFEKVQPSGLGGTPPTLDLFSDDGDHVLGVESKLTEHLKRARRAWSPSYRRDGVAEPLDGRWRQIFDEEVNQDPPTLRYLGIGQLLRHVLGLRKQHPDRRIHLVYCYWEPEDAESVAESIEHRKELTDFRECVAGANPEFHAFSYRELFRMWSDDPLPESLRAHISAARGRYEAPLALR